MLKESLAKRAQSYTARDAERYCITAMPLVVESLVKKHSHTQQETLLYHGNACQRVVGDKSTVLHSKRRRALLDHDDAACRRVVGERSQSHRARDAERCCITAMLVVESLVKRAQSHTARDAYHGNAYQRVVGEKAQSYTARDAERYCITAMPLVVESLV